MEVEYAFLADAAQVSGSKLYVLGGGFNQITAPQFPVLHPYMTLVTKLSLHPMECDKQHKLEIELWDPDGQRLAVVSGEFSAARQAFDPTKQVFAQLVLNIGNQKFPKPGDYAFHIAANGHHLKTLPLCLIEQKLTAPPEQEPRGKA